MADTSSIEWTDATWNPIAGCSLKSPGCTHCYAMPTARRHELMMAALGRVSPYAGLTRVVNGKAVWTGDMRLVEAALTLPLRWQRPRRIFVNSMSDLFHEDVPDEWIDRVFAVMALCPQHTFQVLTKRAARMRAYLSDLDTPGRIRGWIESHEAYSGPVAHFPHLGPEGRWPLPNVWLGVSAEDQRRADERVPDLLATPAAVRFVSAEPLLGPIDFGMIRARGWALTQSVDSLTGKANPSLAGRAPTTTLDWIIVGGESGPASRPMHPDWARQIRDACAAAGVAYLFKQWGAFQHGSTMGRAPSLDRIVFNDGRMLTDVTMPACKAEDRENGWQGRAPEMMALVGKKAAGRLLDGVEHNGFPEVRS